MTVLHRIFLKKAAMPILGSIIKGALQLRETIVAVEDHVEAQQEVLKKLLEKAADTQFGRKYNFKSIRTSGEVYDRFRESVPFHDYSKMNDEWWHKYHDGEKDVSWPGKPPYFARSSGTTGKSSKKIPVTAEMVDDIRRAGTQQVAALTNFNLPPDIFEKDVLALGSSTELEKVGDHKEGEISGISASNIPGILDGFYKPGREISAIEDWDERVQRIAEEAPDWDIGMVSGIPSWILLMMKKVIAYNNAQTIHDVWPNFSVYMSGGVAFEPYQNKFESLCGKKVHVVDTYLASEGFIACQQRPDTTSMQLITDGGIFYEFVPFEDQNIEANGSIKAEAPALTIAEVEEEKDYALIISTVSGAWRYLIGDTIKFTDRKRAEIHITGRTKFFLNVVGSQLSVLKMETAIKELQDKFDVEIPEFTVCAKEIDGEYHHVWYLGVEGDADEEELEKALDDSLKNANKNYKVARSKALKGIIVHKVSPGTFYDWNDHQKKKGGQVKMEKVMKEDKFEKWEEFVGQK